MSHGVYCDGPCESCHAQAEVCAHGVTVNGPCRFCQEQSYLIACKELVEGFAAERGSLTWPPEHWVTRSVELLRKYGRTP